VAFTIFTACSHGSSHSEHETTGAAKRRIVDLEVWTMNAKKRLFLRPHVRIAAFAMLAAAAAPASSAVTTVYKCFDRSLNVVYTDQPCRGEQLDIEAGRADPAALAELQREREALSRAVAQRIADNRRLPVANSDYAVGGFASPIDPEVYYPAGWGSYDPYAVERPRGRGPSAGRHDGRPGTTRGVPAVRPNGITNRTFR
jgi:hypothetical protein